MCLSAPRSRSITDSLLVGGDHRPPRLLFFYTQLHLVQRLTDAADHTSGGVSVLNGSEVSFAHSEVALRRPGVTTTELAERLQSDRVDVELALGSAFLHDDHDRWWPTMPVEKLSRWCFVQIGGPDVHSPPADHWPSWGRVVSVEVAGGLATVTVEGCACDTWHAVAASQLVPYRPHPLAVSGPW